MLDIDYGYNPPFPESKDETMEQDGEETSERKSAGQRLLALVRLLEKKSNSDYDGYESSMQEIVDLFNTLIALYSRRGLLQGNNTKADRIVSTLKSNQKERGQRKTSSRGDHNMKLLDGSNNNSSDINNATGYQQEYLVLTAIVRVLNGASVESSKNSIILDDDQALLIALSSELCVAISQHILTSKDSDNCINAEFELLMQSGKPILSGLVNSLRSLDFDLQRNTLSLSGNPSKVTEKCPTLAMPDHEKHIDPINACFRAAASLIVLFGTKLSRSVALLSDLKSIAWKFLSMNEDSVQVSAAKLIAIIPMAGGTDRKTPSDVWNESMQEVVSMLSTITSIMAPLNKASSNDKMLSEEATARQNMWIQFVRNDISEESQRILTFHRFLRGLTLCFQSLLSRDGMISNNSAPLLGDAKIDLESILGVVETFVSFPLSAETVFYKTKKRLRNEAVEGGLLSARAASTQIGNQIKKLGHGILDCLLESLGGSTLLPFASSITRISYASLVTSCSGPLRKVLDPSSAIQMDGKKRRWLHWSVPMRTTAIKTLKVVLTLFGNCKSEKAGSSVASRSNGEKAIALVVGCYIEEMESSKDMDGVDTSWGTFYERSILM